MVSFLSLFGGDNFVLFRYLSGPKTFLQISFVFFRSLIGDFLFSFFSFCSLPIFDQEFSFAFFRSLIRNFIFFAFSSFKGKDRHSHPGSRFMVTWDSGSKLVERLDIIYVRVLVWPAVQG